MNKTINMKRLIVAASLVLPLLLAGCATKEAVEALELRVKVLEDQVTQLNSQVGVLNTLLEGKYFVQEVAELADGAGYQLTLVDAQGHLTVKQVLNGTPGATPEVNLRADTDGIYYWTLNGNWLLVNGQKVRASNQAPEFKEEDGKWYYRLDGGSWTYAGDAVTEARSLIRGIDAVSSDEVVIITLSDGTVFEVPKASTKLQVLVDETALMAMQPGTTRTVSYELKASPSITVTMSTYEPEGWQVGVSQPVDKKGTFTVKVPANAASGKIMLVATGSDGGCFVLTLPVYVTNEAGKVLVSNLTDWQAGVIALPEGAESARVATQASWIKLQQNKLSIKENTTYDNRQAIVNYTLGGRSYELTVIQAQKDAIVVQTSSLTLSALPQTVDFVVMSNVRVSASSQADWLTTQPVTKGLENKAFSFVVDFNRADASRSAVVRFTSGELVQEMQVTQGIMADEPVLQNSLPGCYLGGGLTRAYVPGTDQYCRAYSGTNVDWVLLNPEEGEQMVLSGYSDGLKVGDSVNIILKWDKNGKTVSSKDLSMFVLQEQDDMVWLGDASGAGLVIKK